MNTNTIIIVNWISINMHNNVIILIVQITIIAVVIMMTLLLHNPRHRVVLAKYAVCSSYIPPPTTVPLTYHHPPLCFIAIAIWNSWYETERESVPSAFNWISNRYWHPTANRSHAHWQTKKVVDQHRGDGSDWDCHQRPLLNREINQKQHRQTHFQIAMVMKQSAVPMVMKQEKQSGITWIIWSSNSKSCNASWQLPIRYSK